MKNRIIVAAVALLAVFLVGFIPEYVRANRLENQLQQARQSAAGAELRDLIALAYVQASQKNYGLAAETSTRFFDRARETAGQEQDAGRQKALNGLLAPRDSVTAALATGDAAVMNDLQQLFLKTRQATGSSSAP